MIQNCIVKMKNKKKGFTLVELIVVIAIIAILAAILLPKYFGFTDDARKSALLSEAKSVRSLADTYYSGPGNGHWPTAKDNGDGTFQIPTGKDSSDADTYDNSPNFDGTLGGTISTDGSFTLTLDKYEATCTADGTITVDNASS